MSAYDDATQRAEAYRLLGIDADTVLERIRGLEAERDRLLDALRASATFYHRSNSHPRDFGVCTWPQCRSARAALAGENTPPPRPRIDKPPATEPRGI